MYCVSPQLQSLAEVTLKFVGPNLHLTNDMFSSHKLHEIMVLQQHCGGSTLCVFRELLPPNSKCIALLLYHPCHPMQSSEMNLTLRNRQKLGLVLFDSVQFSSVEFSGVQFFSVEFSSLQFAPDQFSSVRLSSVRFGSVRFSSVHFNLLQISSVQFSSVQVNSVQFI